LSLKKRCARSAAQKGPMRIMNGPVYVSLYPFFNDAIRAWKAWRKSSIRASVTDEQTVEAYKNFVVLQEAFTSQLRAFQRNRNAHVGEEVATPGNVRGAAGVAGGFGQHGAQILNQLSKIGNLMECRVELESFVGSGSFADPQLMCCGRLFVLC
jgi:hypothetical protein